MKNSQIYSIKVSIQGVFLWEGMNNQTLVTLFGEFSPDAVCQNGRISKKKKKNTR